MSDDVVREQWRRWADQQGIPAERTEAALAAALEVGAGGASPDAGAAAARLATGLGGPGDVDLLRHELAESRRLADVHAARARVLAAALDRRPQPAEAPGPAIAAPPPRRPLGPNAGEFLSEHSILLLSYTGAFLLVVATLLYELYARTGLSGELRFAGVLGLDLVFGAAGWACLRSPRLRLVGHTYVAVFALLAPLVVVAAYVFLGLEARGISLPLAQLLAGSALAVLYAVLAARLRSRAYALLALAAVPVAMLGGLGLAPVGTRRAPEVAVLVVVYALASAGVRRHPPGRLAGRRLPGLADRVRARRGRARARLRAGGPGPGRRLAAGRRRRHAGRGRDRLPRAPAGRSRRGDGGRRHGGPHPGLDGGGP